MLKLLLESRQHFAPEVAAQAEQALYFADFRRDPQLDPDTGEPLEVQPKFYESFPGGIQDIRSSLTELSCHQQTASLRMTLACHPTIL